MGCGTGSWLKVFKEGHGIHDILGIDGANVKASQLLIPAGHFFEHDLRNQFDLSRKFDLVICLEVAEHLIESSASTLVESLCRHGENIIFSAAIPGQGGQNHLNEQWPDFWQQKFAHHGYGCVDAIRPLIWHDGRVDLWYRQNIFIYTRDKCILDMHSGRGVNAVIHPDLWSLKIQSLQRTVDEVNNFEKGGAGIQRSLKALLSAVKNKF